MPGHKLMPSRVMSAQATRGAAQRPSDAAGTARQGSRRRDYEAESAETLNLVPRARSRTRARGGVKWPRRARAKIAAPMLRGRRRRCMSLRGARVASAAIIWHFVVGEAANAAKAARAAARGGAAVAHGADARVKPYAAPQIARQAPQDRPDDAAAAVSMWQNRSRNS